MRMVHLRRWLACISMAVFCGWASAQLYPSNEHYGIAFALCGVWFILFAIYKHLPEEGASGSSLDQVLFQWDKDNPCTLRAILNGGLAIFGRTGSGKSSSSGKKIAEALVGVPNSGGLVLLPKVGELGFWKDIFTGARRKKDMLVFGPRQPLRFNLLDYELKHSGGHEANIVRLLMTISQSLKGNDSDGREQDPFWTAEQSRMLHAAIVILKQATGTINGPDLQRFISGAAASPEQVKDAEWRKGFHAQKLLEGDRWIARGEHLYQKTVRERHDWDLAAQYWLQEIPAMADKTRSSITVGVMGILHVLNTGVVRELFSTTTNVTPDDILAGKWLVVDAPPVGEHGDVGAFINAAWKYVLQRAVMRRTVTSTTPPVVIWADEAHSFVNQHDVAFLATCRSQKGCMVYLSQSLSSYTAAMRGQNPEEKAKALLANFPTKIFHASDEKTAAWAVEMVGRTLKTYINPSFSSHDHPYDEIFGANPGHVSMSTTKHMENAIETTALMHGLRTGGPPSYVADAWVIRNGIPFRNGKPFIRVTFEQ